MQVCSTRFARVISGNGTLTLSALDIAIAGAPSSPIALVSNLTGVGGTEATFLSMFL
jgi:hypothetical protein